ncbi:unnamed protein product, partial [Staurois parvus]
MLSLLCIAREFCFFFSSEQSACDLHRANQHCPYGSRVLHPPRA